jgi:hypothetical protein
MIAVPLSAVPNQTFSIALAKQNAQIDLRQNGDDLYFSLRLGSTPIVTSKICRNRQRLLLSSQYLGFIGDFGFIDLQGDTDPAYAGLGTRYFLLYLEDDE